MDTIRLRLVRRHHLFRPPAPLKSAPASARGSPSAVLPSAGCSFPIAANETQEASAYVFLLLLAGCSARPLYPLPGRRNDRSKQALQNFRPYNTAHRGFNGEFPEESGPAYMRAIEEGADFIETDIQSSKDGILVCIHDVTLDATTDIAEHKECSGRETAYIVQGVNTTGYFVVDFTLEELKTLRLKQRYPFRDQQHNEFSESLVEMGNCLLETTSLDSDGECACGGAEYARDKVYKMNTLGKVYKELFYSVN